MSDFCPTRSRQTTRPAKRLKSTPTGAPRSYETAPPYDPTIGLYLGPYGGPRGGALSYDRGTPVLAPSADAVLQDTILRECTWVPRS